MANRIWYRMGYRIILHGVQKGQNGFYKLDDVQNMCLISTFENDVCI